MPVPDAVMGEREPYMLVFAIEHLPMLPNALTNRAHWSAIRKHAKEWHWRIIQNVGMNRPRRPLDRAVVRLTRYSASAPDQDNLFASWKPVIDALVRVGVLRDDSPDHIKVESGWGHAPRGSGYIDVRVMEVTG